MTKPRPSALLDRLAPEVASFSTPQPSPRFVLADDLGNLDKVHQVRAPEAVIFYSARILDALAAAALDRIGVPATPNVYANLDALQQFNLLPTATRYWAHTLRRTGNLVRHIHRRIEAEDVELSVLFVERWLDWFFRVFRLGPRLESLTQDRAPLGLSPLTPLRNLVEKLDAANLDSSESLLLLQGEYRRLSPLRTPAVPAVLAELLLERGEHADAWHVLEAALARFPEDLRLRQLQGLWYSRGGELTKARELLEKLFDQYREDDETAGITAGVYKKLWLAKRDDPGWLEKSYRAYRHSWDRSRRSNVYLGINAATTALWLDSRADSRRLALEVQQLLVKRQTDLARHGTGLSLNYWDRVTLAEAELLLGRLATARRTYQEVFAQHAGQQSNIEVSKKQANEILQQLGLTCTIQQFLNQPATADTGPTLTIGVTGHRTIPADNAFRQRVVEALEMIRQRCGGAPARRLVILSPLAEGADRLAAHLVLGTPMHGALHVVLPLELSDYRQDFGSAESQAEFQVLFDLAELITITASALATKPGDRTAAYEACGRFVVDHCEVLLALWDGEPARGLGGTGHIVEYARSLGKPVVWVRTLGSYPVQCEGMNQGKPGGTGRSRTQVLPGEK